MSTKFDKNLSVDSTRSEHIRPYVAEMPSIVRDIHVFFYSFISLDLSAIWKSQKWIFKLQDRKKTSGEGKRHSALIRKFESWQIWQDLPDIKSKKLLT